MVGKVLMNYNFKGGVGKSTLTAMQGYLMAKKNKKILLIDFDPQENLSEMICDTYKIYKDAMVPFSKSLNNGNLSSSIVSMTNNLDIIKADDGLNEWTDRISNLKKSVRWNILREKIEPLKNDYDYILIDVPPTFNDIVANAIFACDGISVVLQTQKMSYTSALKTVKKLISLRAEYNPSFKFLGVIIYLYQKAKIDNEIAKDAQNYFKKAVYENKIQAQERVKGFTAYGITERDHWDFRSIGMYQRVVDEIEERAQEMI
ncbi:ParA family protein [Apilactobacillus xinyiensis]|uniref:ParA family protein n=1 Tax=Apilactobacillus xinyiensis TaxID=2841032 RepID=UPI001C7CCDA6|nr:ParA family protein [Apilactobacillus xinyiensis]